MSSSRLIRWSGLLAILGGAIWTAAWILNGLTEDGTRTVLELSEGGYRRITNAALLLFMVGLVGFHKRQAGRSGKLGTRGLIVALVGCALMIIGNVFEFGLIGGIPDGERPGMMMGWIIFALGLIFIVPMGLVVFGVGVIKAKVLPSWSRALPLVIGLISLLGIFIGIVQSVLRGDTVAEWGLITIVFSLGLGWVLLGFALWSDTQETLTQPSM